MACASHNSSLACCYHHILVDIQRTTIPMEEEMTDELLPCPFCGGDAHRIEYDTPDPDDVICKNDDCRLSGIVFSIAEWNTRTPKLDWEALREEVARAIWPELWAHEDKNADAFNRLNSCTVESARARGAAKVKAQAAISVIKAKINTNQQED